MVADVPQRSAWSRQGYLSQRARIYSVVILRASLCPSSLALSVCRLTCLTVAMDRKLVPVRIIIKSATHRLVPSYLHLHSCQKGAVGLHLVKSELTEATLGMLATR